MNNEGDRRTRKKEECHSWTQNLYKCSNSATELNYFFCCFKYLNLQQKKISQFYHYDLIVYVLTDYFSIFANCKLIRKIIFDW